MAEKDGWRIRSLRDGLWWFSRAYRGVGALGMEGSLNERADDKMERMIKANEIQDSRNATSFGGLGIWLE